MSVRNCSWLSAKQKCYGFCLGQDSGGATGNPKYYVRATGRPLTSALVREVVGVKSRFREEVKCMLVKLGYH